ncbi:ABC transporter permease [Halalkalicoccus jeotgali]|uniref:ABC-2 type transporter n=1 Tax=Halalkalicoccus jeotgali (strain DSM 18796 / CECT 7217 / JCM 14584 / KCTC 4019 / B3) TaxID=795797 RepID=D8JA07_HALJB|nr:ABC transporter permease [Halalkalicoccus jeotgali]ADJ14529.1 ABC-2 type transporter [Halalkalicoccus jeotgali B3]ELY40101.1 ABC-2 type transporter [Halalkalicoccus jeotgali B3]
MSTPDGVVEQRSGNAFAIDVWIVLKRWLIKTTRNPFVVVSSLVQPIVFLVLFTEVFGQVTGGALAGALGAEVNYITYLVPAIVIQSALVAAAGSGIGLVDDMESGMFEKVLVSPISRGAMFLGKALSEVVRIVVQTVIILVLGYVLLWIDTGGEVGTYVETGLLGVLGILGVTVVFAIWFTAFSNVVALVTRDQEATIIGANLLQFPLLFVSSAFLPVEVLPGWVQAVATVNPITYGVDAVRALVLGRDVLAVLDVTAFGGIWNTLVPALGLLVALDLLLGAIAVGYLNRASSSQVD